MARGLGEHPDNLVPGLNQGAECGHAEFTAAGEEDVDGVGQCDSCGIATELAAFFR
jgi:hypothetical protein